MVCICQDQHRRGYCTEPGCPYAVERKRLDDMELADLRRVVEVMQASEVLWRQTDRALRDEIARHQRNVRHWREECGKLHAQVQMAKDQRNAYQKEAQIARTALAAFANEENWWQGRRFDPTSAWFDGIAFAAAALSDAPPPSGSEGG